MEKSIRVNILDRSYPLRVEASDEDLMREIASFVDERIRSVRESYPNHPELTSAIVTTLALAEDLVTEREENRELQAEVETELQHLVEMLDEVIDEK